MLDQLFQNKLNHINGFKRRFDKLNTQAQGFLKTLKPEFEKLGISFKDQEGNQLEFHYFGLDFIIKAEAPFLPEGRTFVEGKLTTYLKQENKEEEIFHFTFDSIGNIDHRFSNDDFAIPYFVNFVDHLMTFAKSNGTVFRLS